MEIIFVSFLFVFPGERPYGAPERKKSQHTRVTILKWCMASGQNKNMYISLNIRPEYYAPPPITRLSNICLPCVAEHIMDQM